MTYTSPFKICYLLKRYPSLSETFVANEMLELQRQGIEIIIVAKHKAHHGIVYERSKALNAPIYYLPPASSMSLDTSGTYNVPDVYAVKEELSPEDRATRIQAAMIAPVITRLGINHIHAHFATWAATAASYVSDMTGIPFSFTAHARDIYREGVDKRALAEKIEKAQFVITVSDFNKRYLSELIRSEGRSGHIVRIYNGVDLSLLHTAPPEKEPGLLVGVGRLVQKKGFEYLIDACKILKDRGRHFHCSIVGEGDRRAILEKQVTQYSLEKDVSLLGARSHTEVIRIIQRAALCVLPCVVGDDGDRDGLPTVLLEAMALGTPVISTHITGIPEMIDHGRTGLLVEEKNPAALAQAIEDLLDSTPLCKRLSRAALTQVRKEFNLVENVKKLKGLFLSGGGRP